MSEYLKVLMDTVVYNVRDGNELPLPLNGIQALQHPSVDDITVSKKT